MRKVILIALAFVTLQAVAQEKKKGDIKKDRQSRMMVKDLSPEEIATLGSKKMTLALDLTEKQQTEVKAILLEQATSRKKKMEAFKEMKEKDDAKKPSKEERLKMMNEKLDHQIAMKKKMKAILNAEQFEKWEKIQAKRSGERGKRNFKKEIK